MLSSFRILYNDPKDKKYGTVDATLLDDKTGHVFLYSIVHVNRQIQNVVVWPCIPTREDPVLPGTFDEMKEYIKIRMAESEQKEKVVIQKDVSYSKAKKQVEKVGERTTSSLEAADAILRRWSKTAPEKGHGYHKVDFKITWQDGESYDGRYDLEHEDGTKKNLIGEHVQQFLSFHAGYWCPPHLTREEYVKYLEQSGFGEGSENRVMARKLLEDYEL